MSPKTTALAAGLTAMGLLGPATRCVARQGGTPAPAESPSPSAPAPTVILLSNGKVLRGEVAKDESGYVVTQRLGPIPVARRDVVGVFPSLEEAYRFQRDRLPKGDPDESMKLARWCIEQGLKAEAREQLAAVLAAAEGHPRAVAMLAMLDADAQRAARRDPDVVRTGGPAEPDDAPGPLDLDALRKPSKLRQPAGPPVIFDLPPALAVRRYQEFVERVHPELQLRCAGCHNERSESRYQLLQARTPRARKDALLLRANLDATLRLVDPANPVKSELLTSAIMPHGKVNQPVLSGPNHPAYRALAHWVAGLQSAPKPPDGGATPAGFTSSSAPPPPAGFAADRSAAPAPPLPSPSPPVPSPTRPPAPEPVEVAHPSVPPGVDFRTVSPMLGAGPNAAPIGAPSKPAAPTPAPTPATPPNGLPQELKPLTAQDLDKLAGKRKSPRKIDPALLQKVMTKGNPGP